MNSRNMIHQTHQTQFQDGRQTCPSIISLICIKMYFGRQKERTRKRFGKRTKSKERERENYQLFWREELTFERRTKRISVSVEVAHGPISHGHAEQL